jgi:hypothetical protein
MIDAIAIVLCSAFFIINDVVPGPTRRGSGLWRGPGAAARVGAQGFHVVWARVPRGRISGHPADPLRAHADMIHIPSSFLVYLRFIRIFRLAAVMLKAISPISPDLSPSRPISPHLASSCPISPYLARSRPISPDLALTRPISP